jgi:hypothetical protein
MEGLDVISYSFIKIIYNKPTLKKQKNNINELVLFNSSLTAPYKNAAPSTHGCPAHRKNSYIPSKNQNTQLQIRTQLP